MQKKITQASQLITPSKPYFKNLDALRFIAFLSVMLAHAWQVKSPEQINERWWLNFQHVTTGGVLGVNFFFVLSGFLITYLLLLEEVETGRFSIVRYYLRRTLRIWPLYFLIVTASFVIIPLLMNIIGHPYNETAKPIFFFLFLSNFYIINFGFPYSPLLGVLWSIAVEEQFYIVWPWLLKIFKSYKDILFFALVAVNVLFRFLHYDQSKLLYFHTLSIVSDFAIGGWLASRLIREGRLLTSIKKTPRWLIAACYFAIILLVVFYDDIFSNKVTVSLERFILGIAFGFIILEQTFCENRILNTGKIPGFTWLGKRSYGLYCFHEAGILASIKLMQSLGCLTSPLEYLLFMPMLAFAITVVMAALSYRFFEKPFLDWKKKFEVVTGQVTR